jgi:hypothetical protein
MERFAPVAKTALVDDIRAEGPRNTPCQDIQAQEVILERRWAIPLDQQEARETIVWKRH